VCVIVNERKGSNKRGRPPWRKEKRGKQRKRKRPVEQKGRAVAFQEKGEKKVKIKGRDLPEMGRKWEKKDRGRKSQIHAGGRSSFSGQES